MLHKQVWVWGKMSDDNKVYLKDKICEMIYDYQNNEILLSTRLHSSFFKLQNLIYLIITFDNTK